MDVDHPQTFALSVSPVRRARKSPSQLAPPALVAQTDEPMVVAKTDEVVVVAQTDEPVVRVQSEVLPSRAGCCTASVCMWGDESSGPCC